MEVLQVSEPLHRTAGVRGDGQRAVRRERHLWALHGGWVLRRETHQAIEALGVSALPVEISFSVRVGAAARYGRPTFLLEPDGREAEARRRLAKHLLEAETTVRAAARAPAPRP